MKKFTIKSLLIAAALCLGTNAWAYEIPEGLEVKSVFIGSLNSGKIVPEDFTNMERLDASWNVGTINSIGIAEVAEIAKPEIGSKLDEGVVPTYVSGKAFRGYLRQGSSAGNCFATYSFGNISTGKLVFSGDLYASNNVNGPIILRFEDTDGNNVFTINYSNGRGTRYLQYTIGSDNAKNSSVTSNYRTYAGYGIKDLVVDFATGDVSFVFDYINTNAVRTNTKVSFNIGTGKSISRFSLGKPAVSRTDLYYYLDNVELYTVGTVSGTYNYSVVAKCADKELKTLLNGTCKGGVKYSVTGLPLVIEKDGRFYMLNDNNVVDYRATFTMGNADETKIISYKEADDIVFFAESQSETTGTAAYSNGAKGNVAGQNKRDRGISVGTLPIGAYEFIVNIVEANRRSVVARVGAADPFAAVGTSNSDMTTGIKSATFTLTEETSNIIINGANSGTASANQSEEFDYVIIKRTGDATVSTTITAAGYATFSAAYAVDFSKAEGLTAYTATVNGNKVVMTPIENGIVPANTGVILKGAENNYTGVITTTEDVIENNDLVAATEGIASLATETTVDEVKYKNYILNVVNETPGFYQAAGNKVAAGKAYLQVPVEIVAGAKALTIVWNDGETTGIEENYEFGTMNSDAATFDLSGRKVANPAKGLYIKNGKKFIVK